MSLPSVIDSIVLADKQIYKQARYISKSIKSMKDTKP